MANLTVELFETLPANGWLTLHEAQLLWSIASQTSGPILEVGCYYGRSTVLLAQLGRPVYAVDPFDGFDSDKSGDEVCKAFIKNLESRAVNNVLLFRQRVEDWRVMPVSFAYLDGDHTYKGTLNQIETTICCGATDVCVHDYADKGGGVEVKKAVSQSPLSLRRVVGIMAYCTL